MGKQQGRSVVVGVDFGECGDDALVEALRLFDIKWATSLHPVHVIDPREVRGDSEKDAVAAEEEVLALAPAALRDRLRQMANMLGLNVPEEAVKPHARIGKPVDALIQVAVDYEADLIVVGTHGRRGLDRAILGSVAETLVRTATCPVLVARPKDHSRRPKSERPDPPYAPGEAPVYRAPHDSAEHISTEVAGWHPSDNGPTGIRIV